MDLLIGDVQGCDEALGRLLDAAGFSPSRDHAVLLGDLVNRGPQSLAVLRRMAALDGAASCVLGNHDLHLLAVAHGVRPLHASDTLQDMLGAEDRAQWLDWLRTQPLARMHAGWLCVHAGLLPQWTADRALALSTEVQALLASPEGSRFLHQMYGNEPAQWGDDLTGADRWRVVVNAMTRLRFCDAHGRMDFKTKEGAGAAPEGYTPWFEAPGRLSADTPIAFGHWSTLGLRVEPRLLALDTGCVWGGPLTAVRVDGGRREVIQVPSGRPLAHAAPPMSSGATAPTGPGT